MNSELSKSIRNVLWFCTAWPGLAEFTGAAELTVSITQDEGEAVSEAVVEAVPADGAELPADLPSMVMDQIDKAFVPRVLAVAAGTPVNFPNKDNIHHHVYSFSPAKQFELPLYEGTPADPVVFDQPGVVALGCNIHDWMRGYIYVTESPYFGISGEDGKVVLSGLDTGEYTLRVWHSNLRNARKPHTQNLQLEGDQNVTVDLKLKPKLRIRRMPGSGSYR